VNIFGVGGAELVVIFVIMLVVAGPKRMIRWAYVLGQYVGKLRKLWGEVVDMMQDEADAAGLGIKIPKDLPTKQGLTKLVADAVKPYSDELNKPVKELQDSLRDTASEANSTVKESAESANLGAWSANNDNSNGLGTWEAPANQDTKREAEDGTRRS
jgi:Sec-independent protein translocase protein TatA